MTGDDIQIEDGNYTRIHNSILEAITLADFSKREYKCLLFLLRQTYGWQRKEDTISYQQFADGTGLAYRHVRETLVLLLAKKVIFRTINGAGKSATWGFNKYREIWDLKPRTVQGGPHQNSAGLAGQPRTKTVQPTLHQNSIANPAPKQYSQPRTKTVQPTLHQNSITQKKEKETIKEKERKREARCARAAAPPPAPPTTHPAILVFDELKCARPPKRLLPLIEDGGITDLALWREAVRAWLGHGYSPTNVLGMLDWYREPARFQKQPHYANGSNTHGRGSIIAAFAELYAEGGVM